MVRKSEDLMQKLDLILKQNFQMKEEIKQLRKELKEEKQ